MTKFDAGATAKQKEIDAIISSQRLIKEQHHNNWHLKAYWGQVPNEGRENVKRLGFCGYAISKELSKSSQPDLSNGCGTQVIIDQLSVIVWSSDTERGLDEKIKQTFKNFEWRTNEHIE